jgi:hypothetical protein
MAFLDFITKNRNASPEQTAPIRQPEPSRSIESLPDHVKAQAVEAARPAAELIDRATTPRNDSLRPQPTPVSPAKERGLGMER